MNGTAAVDEFLAALDHPFSADVQTLRGAILDAHPRVAERIKWKSPSFHVDGVDIGAFELRPTAFLRLILVFPNGVVADPEGIMSGTWADRRELRFHGAQDVAAKIPALERIVRDWVDLLYPRATGTNR